uniref:Uncharacterized protein n=1 Tax=Ditylenchus dipsaci TaxID=166011 RepID=A0A915CYP5_9BILA
MENMENLQQMKNSNNNSVSRKRSRKDGQRGLSRFIVDGKCSYKDPNTQMVCGYSQTPSNIARSTGDASIPVISSGRTRAQRLLTLLSATSTLQVCFVEKDYFKQLLGMIPGFVMPSRRQLNEMMESELQKMQKNLLQLIKDSPGLAMSADIGSTRNNKHSFLLIMAISMTSRSLVLCRWRSTLSLCEPVIQEFILRSTVAQEDEFTLQLQRENALEDADEEEEEDRGIDIRYNSDQLEDEEGDDEESLQEDLFAKLRHIDCSAHRLQIPSKMSTRRKEVRFRPHEKRHDDARPLMNFTIRLQEESSPTISLLLPGLNSILEEYKKITPNELVKSLSQNIRTRFAEVWTSSLFEAASSLDYRTLPFILKEKTEAEIGKTLKKMYLTRFSSNEDVTAEDRTDAQEEVEENDLFGVGSSASWALEPAPNSLEMEIAVYFDKAKSWGIGKKGSTWSFWKFHGQHIDKKVFGQLAMNL